jgi:ribonuclease HI
MTGKLTIICDGGRRSDVAYGSYKLLDATGSLLEHNQAMFGDGTSNEAEYKTLITALRKVVKEYPDVEHVDIYMDSALVVNQVQDEWNCNFDHLKKLKGAVETLLTNVPSYEFHLVKRDKMVRWLGH